jgi:uncharacterized protein
VCETAASDGHAYGKFLLGVMKVKGLAGPKDEAAGIALIAEGAEANISDAQKALGMVYQLGHGVAVNYPKAIYWYKRSVVSNNLIAMLYLGGMYIYGQGVPIDLSRGYAYVSLAAERGNEKAKETIEVLNTLPEFTPEVKKRAEKIREKLSREIKG